MSQGSRPPQRSPLPALGGRFPPVQSGGEKNHECIFGVQGAKTEQALFSLQRGVRGVERMFELGFLPSLDARIMMGRKYCAGKKGS